VEWLESAQVVAIEVMRRDAPGNEDLIKGKSIQSRHAGRDAARDMAGRIGSTGEVESDFGKTEEDWRPRQIGLAMNPTRS
jgi:hypothetical protein